MPDREISSIRHLADGTVEVMTGDPGTASGDVIVLKRSGSGWQVERIGNWVE